MEKRYCPGCDRWGLEKEFNRHSSRSGGLQPYCRECQRSRNNIWAKTERGVAGRRRRRAANKALLVEEILKHKSLPCPDCGNSFHFSAMDFDHVRGEKLFDISAITGSTSLETLRAEIKKCEVVCANCHRLRTWRRMTESRNQR